MPVIQHGHDTAKYLRINARFKLENHRCSSTLRDRGGEELVVRDNCGACALNGWAPVVDEGPAHPNYAGWARLYVQAGKGIPAVFREAFEDERVTDGPYAAGLARDIATFGATYDD